MRPATVVVKRTLTHNAMPCNKHKLSQTQLPLGVLQCVAVCCSVLRYVAWCARVCSTENLQTNCGFCKQTQLPVYGIKTALDGPTRRHGQSGVDLLHPADCGVVWVAATAGVPVV